MRERVEVKGLWWLPDKPESRIPGTLVFDPGSGTRLSLAGTFQKIRSSSDVPPTFEVVLGVTDSGGLITLVKCAFRNGNFDVVGVLLSELEPEIILSGAHFNSLADLKFHRISARLTDLNEWVGLSGFDIGFPTENGEALIKYRLPTGPRALLDNGDEVSVDFALSGLGWQRHQSKAEIVQKVYMTYRPVSEVSLHELLDRIWSLQQFMSFAVLRPVDVTEMQVYSRNHSRVVNDKEFPSPIDIYFRSEDMADHSSPTLQEYMLFSVPQLADSFEVTIRKWFNTYFEIKDVIDIYIGTLRNRSMYLQHQFLSLCQALEAFHRLKIGGTLRSKSEHRELLRRLRHSVSKDVWCWLKGLLSHSNDLSLRLRLECLYETFCPELESILGARTRFARQVVLNRNYLTHYESRLKDKALRGLDLYVLCEKMRILMAICLLKTMEFPEPVCAHAKLLLGNQFRQLVALNRWTETLE